ncbi:MAG: SGNH/GDSL hydrolase family protein [Candidatus Omnitrophica bacterium]|nr:SGNH/GDSL hydrolase family protein [Candidatus Omnitrophota bacterium]
MKFFSYFLLFSILPGMGFAQKIQEIEKLDPNFAIQEPGKEVLWYDLKQIGTEGQGWTDTKSDYDRLPAKAEGVVRDPVWRLSEHSAGICSRFVTDSPTISARWILRSANLEMNHMAATGVSGLDLYAKSDEGWRWVATGRPSEVTNEVQLINETPGGLQEYLLYLPLYNGVEKVEIGIAPGKMLGKSPKPKSKPLVFYGTSITQGGCASRSGMAHPEIIGRDRDVPVINLGFSGNGKMDPEIGDLLVELDPSVYIIDCCPNMNPEMILERTIPLVERIRQDRPVTPILLVENIEYQRGWFSESQRAAYEDKNAALKQRYEELIEKGVEGLYYLPCDGMLGDDANGTVDGVHPTDLGFFRMAHAFEPVLREILGEK